ncbi:MAG TPA: hypothetical protein VGK27_11450 [Candidatus Deferrimicrobiaceae bacterium]|jgi:hypothetical protein
MKGQPKRRYLIDIRTQIPFLLKIGSVWAGGIVLLCGLLYYLADEQLGQSFYSIHQRLRNTWQILLPAVLVSGGLSFLVTIGTTVFLALRESHRLGGPIFKFNKLFKELESGILHTDFRFRNGDLLFDMGENYRAALQANRERMRALRHATVDAERAVKEMELSILAHNLPAEEAELVRDVARKVLLAREEAQRFDLGAES